MCASLLDKRCPDGLPSRGIRLGCAPFLADRPVGSSAARLGEKLVFPLANGRRGQAAPGNWPLFCAFIRIAML